MERKQRKKSPEDTIVAETISRVYISCIVTNPESELVQYSEERDTGHTTILGSKRAAKAIKDVVKDNSTDKAFTAFRSHIASAIRAFDPISSDTIYPIGDSHKARHLGNPLRLH